MCLNLTTLSDHNRLAPSATAVAVVLVGASVYAILFRGLLAAATSQRVFDSIYSNSAGAEDLATLAKKIFFTDRQFRQPQHWQDPRSGRHQA
jgi:hypothetical protein